MEKANSKDKLNFILFFVLSLLVSAFTFSAVALVERIFTG
jgi:hypothetical protein